MKIFSEKPEIARELPSAETKHVSWLQTIQATIESIGFHVSSALVTHEVLKGLYGESLSAPVMAAVAAPGAVNYLRMRLAGMAKKNRNET